MTSYDPEQQNPPRVLEEIHPTESQGVIIPTQLEQLQIEVRSLREEVVLLTQKQQVDTTVAYEERKQIKIRQRVQQKRFQKISAFVLLFAIFVLCQYVELLSEESLTAWGFEPSAIRLRFDLLKNFVLAMSVGVWAGKPGEMFANFLSTTLKIPVPLPSSSPSPLPHTSSSDSSSIPSQPIIPNSSDSDTTPE